MSNGLSGSILFRCHAESEVGLHGKGKLIDENLLESGNIVLLVEDKHSLNQNCIAGDAGSALVAVGEWLDVGKEHQGQKGFPKGSFYFRLKYTKNTAQIPKF